MAQIELNLTEVANNFSKGISEGNPYVFGFVAIFGLGFVMIRYGDKVLKILKIFSWNRNDEKERITKYRDHLSKVITDFKGLRMSKDVGRNLFYHYIIGEKFHILFTKLNEVCDAYLEGKISRKEFVSYNSIHWKIIHDAKLELKEKMSNELRNQEWSEEHINYILEVFHGWFYGYTKFLVELINISKTPIEVIVAWWMLFYNIYLQSEKFGMVLNGHITGNHFNKLKIGEPDKSMEENYVEQD